MGFWKFAGYNILRIVGILSALLGIFGGLIAFGNQRTDGIILSISLFISGILFTWYGSFKMRTTTIEYGIGHQHGNKYTPQLHKPKRKMKRRNKLIIISVIIILIAILFVAFSPSILVPKISGKLYFQSTVSDWAKENYVMSPILPNGETKNNSVWYGSLKTEFVSTQLRQEFEFTELTFSFYHNQKESSGSFNIELYFVDTNGRVQLITKSCKVEVTQYSRFSVGTTTFNPSFTLLPNERLHFRISANLWYWASSEFPSQVTYKGIPRYEEIPVF